jgi:hypothetical protein
MILLTRREWDRKAKTRRWGAGGGNSSENQARMLDRPGRRLVVFRHNVETRPVEVHRIANHAAAKFVAMKCDESLRI